MSRFVRDDGSKRARFVLIGDKGDLFRFITKVCVEQETGCWLWTGSKNRNGYGKFWYHGRTGTAFRFAYKFWHGPLPPGHEPDHLCENKICVNPDHLEGVTRRENLIRGNSPVGLNARKLHCIRGHTFTTTTTYSWRGQRYCRICNNNRAKARYAADPEKFRRRRREYYAKIH